MVVATGRDPTPLLSLGVGGTIAAQFGLCWNLACRLKWPNDLVISGPGGPTRKLGGVIVDTLDDRADGRVAVVGVGINVRTPAEGFPATRPLSAVGLDELVPECPSLAAVERVVVPAIETVAAELTTTSGRHDLLDRCAGRLFGIGRSALVDGRPSGRIRGLAADGALELDLDGEPMTIRAGDLTVLDP
jgi:biotin-(acetyl-CoA carboxylase) ligase